MVSRKEKLQKILKHGYETGKMLHGSGLCKALHNESITLDNFKNFSLFEPSHKEFLAVSKSWQPALFWGREDFNNDVDEFTPLRETVLGFLIAMEK